MRQTRRISARVSKRRAPRAWSATLLCAILLAASSLRAQSDGGSSESAPDGAATESPTADELARAVHEKAGDPTGLESLAFTFVVEVAGEVKVRRRHVWRPSEGRLVVETDERSVELRGLGERDPTALTENPAEHAATWREIAPDAKPEAAAKAWSQFINDSYWLLAPSKLLDPGVRRKLDSNGRLVLTFDEVGLTPGDRYTLTVDRDRHVVTRWEFDLQSGRSGAFRWTDYRQFGPLYLSTRRISESKKNVVIRFENIEAAPE